MIDGNDLMIIITLSVRLRGGWEHSRVNRSAGISKCEKTLLLTCDDDVKLFGR